MEKCGFQSELLSVLEALARAAVAEINRRVEDSCAVLRLEVSRGRRDIELLKGKCELMEAELRRSRLRARRRVVYSPAPPLVRVVLQSKGTAEQMEAEAPLQPQQSDDAEVCNQAEHVQIKEECSEEDVWRNESLDKPISAAEPCFKASPPPQTSDGFLDSCFQSAETSAEPLVPLSAGHASELLVKREQEEEPDENAAPLEAGHRSAAAEGDDQTWLSDLRQDAAEPNVPYAGQQIHAAFTSRDGLHADDTAARIQPVGKCHTVAMANAARMKRRARTFGFRRAQADEAAHGGVSQLRSSDPSSAPQHLRDSAPRYRDEETAAGAAAANAPFAGHGGGGGGDGSGGGGGGGFVLTRRIRAPWMSGVRRFGCTYCDKTFMRFSQLKEHLRSHTGEKPFSCLQCGRSFTKHCNLVRHAVVHSGEKPYQCALCGKCFTQRSSLKSHQNTAH